MHSSLSYQIAAAATTGSNESPDVTNGLCLIHKIKVFARLLLAGNVSNDGVSCSTCLTMSFWQGITLQHLQTCQGLKHLQEGVGLPVTIPVVK